MEFRRVLFRSSKIASRGSKLQEADSRKSAGSLALTPWSWQSSPSSVAELRTSPEASKPAPQSIFMAQKESLNVDNVDVDNVDSGHCQEGGLRWPDVLCAPKR